LRIVIVDDAAVERAIFARIAVTLGHEIAGEAADVTAGAHLAREHRPNLIVLDGRLPGAGLDAIELLLAAAPDAHVAVIASVSELDLVRAARARGASAALLRPLLASQVAQVLDELSVENGG
jgi:DNA-binding NarL/FixJ family response regulator